MTAMDESIAGIADREASSAAGSVRCISCGTNYAPMGRGPGGGGDSPERGQLLTASHGNHGNHSSHGTYNNNSHNQNFSQNYHGSVCSTGSTVASPEHFRPGSVSGSLSTYSSEQFALSGNMNGMTAAEYSRREAEEYLAVIRRQGGLKPLTRHSMPLQTRTNPYVNSGTYVSSHRHYRYLLRNLFSFSSLNVLAFT